MAAWILGGSASSAHRRRDPELPGFPGPPTLIPGTRHQHAGAMTTHTVRRWGAVLLTGGLCLTVDYLIYLSSAHSSLILPARTVRTGRDQRLDRHRSPVPGPWVAGDPAPGPRCIRPRQPLRPRLFPRGRVGTVGIPRGSRPSPSGTDPSCCGDQTLPHVSSMGVLDPRRKHRPRCGELLRARGKRDLRPRPELPAHVAVGLGDDPPGA